MSVVAPEQPVTPAPPPPVHPLTLYPKTTAASAGGALSVLVVWLLGLYHVQVDPVTASALSTVVAAFCAWLAPIVDRETGGTP